MQVPCGFLGANRHRLAQQNRPGIQPCLHLHDAHASLCIPGHDGAMNGGGPPPPGQEAGVDIQTATRGRIQNRLRQNEAIGHHHRHIRLERHKFRLRARIPQAHRMAHRQATRLGSRLDRAGAVLFATPRRARRLAVNGCHLMPRCHQRVEHRHREIGRSHEDHSHARAFHCSQNTLIRCRPRHRLSRSCARVARACRV